MKPKSAPPWHLIASCLLLLMTALLSACQPVQPQATNTATAPTIPEVLIEVNDTEFTIPPDFPGGIVRVTVKNNGSKDLDIGFGRVHEGSSLEEIEKLNQDFMNNLLSILQKVSLMASFNPVSAGTSQQAIIDFRSGQFLLDATEHVNGPPNPEAAHIYAVFKADKLVGTVEPQTDVKVEMTDFAFVMPDEIKAGKQLWEYTNEGKQWHMQFFLKLKPDATMEEVMAALAAEGEPSAPLPFEEAQNAGIVPMSEGERVWLEFALEPGTYLVACPLPDVTTLSAGGPPTTHLQHGMHRILTVK